MHVPKLIEAMHPRTTTPRKFHASSGRIPSFKPAVWNHEAVKVCCMCIQVIPAGPLLPVCALLIGLANAKLFWSAKDFSGVVQIPSARGIL